ncbi:unnamed protein product [Toxocara canis]|uniref:Secreted protein n=1 Tax=Toxocara canis TaxID=6265 RepID=A0A183UNX3_TOXCA|nr:unnamed protein product [Toxocara canis]
MEFILDALQYCKIVLFVGAVRSKVLVTCLTKAITVTTQASTGKDSDEDSDSDENERINWECGTDDFTKIISESTIDRDCPELKADEITTAALIQLRVESNSLCLQNATRSSEVCSKEDAPAFCALVREFGELPYKASAKSTAK